ncbi:MAG: PD-(D/E)XK nuclease family protein [Deltaproteobacteria bacterium]|nr:PD-(D/E)XK nuclease family protein [Deltaproteobacteria bacterium]
MPTLYSHSRLSSFETCKKKFYFRYVQGLPQRTEGIEAFVGKRVHEVLERLYRFVEEERIPSLPKVQKRYYALFDEHYDPTRVKIVKQGMDVSHYRDLGAQCIENHYRRHYPFDEGETLGIEQRVVFDLDEAGQYEIQGVIDRIVRTRDGVIEIQDYKTGSYVPSQKKLDTDRQLALYQIGVARQLETDAPIRLVWHYLARGRTCTSTRTPEQLEALQRETIELIDRIQAETHFPAQKNNLCPWCEYKDVCPAFGHTPPPAEPQAGGDSAEKPGQLSLL